MSGGACQPWYSSTAWHTMSIGGWWKFLWAHAAIYGSRLRYPRRLKRFGELPGSLDGRASTGAEGIAGLKDIGRPSRQLSARINTYRPLRIPGTAKPRPKDGRMRSCV